MRILIFLFSLIILFHGQAFAQIPTDVNSQIDELKNKVASRVAELKLVEKRGIIGIVSEVSGTKITLADLNKNVKIVDVDELTDFSSEDGKSIGLSDIKKGMKIGVIGLYNKESERLLARFIDEVKMPEFIIGGVTKKDPQNFIITVVTPDGKEYSVSVEDVTKTYSVGANENLSRLGFSKINEKKDVVVVGFFDPKVKQKITATRIYYFEGLPIDPKISAIAPALDEASKSIPSTGSGKKLTPL